MRSINGMLITLSCILGTLQTTHAATSGPTRTADCLFPGSTHAAPAWVCDAPVDGYEITAVGSGGNLKDPEYKLTPFQESLLSALNGLMQNVKVEIVKSPNKIKDAKPSADDKPGYKQIINQNIGKNITFQSILKEYAETSGKENLTIRSSTIKLSMTQPCTYTLKSLVENTDSNGKETVLGFGEEYEKKCSIKDLIKELSSAGVNIVEGVISPADGSTFLLLGIRMASDLRY